MFQMECFRFSFCFGGPFTDAEQTKSSLQLSLLCFKETMLERADFALQLSMFVTAENEEEMFIILFISSFS